MTELRVDVEGVVHRDAGDGWVILGAVEKRSHRGHTNRMGWRWFPRCADCSTAVGYDHGYETRKKAIRELVGHVACVHGGEHTDACERLLRGAAPCTAFTNRTWWCLACKRWWESRFAA